MLIKSHFKVVIRLGLWSKLNKRKTSFRS